MLQPQTTYQYFTCLMPRHISVSLALFCLGWIDLTILSPTECLPFVVLPFQVVFSNLPSSKKSLPPFSPQGLTCIFYSMYYNLPYTMELIFMLVSIALPVINYHCISQIYSQCFKLHLLILWSSLIAQLVKNPPAMQETPVWFLGWEDPLEKG